MFVENLSKKQTKKSARIQAMVRTARSRFLLLLFFSLSLPVASAKNITSSLPSISLWRNCRAALLKPIMSWGTEKDGDGKVSSQGWELTDPSRKAPNETWPIGFRSKVEDVGFFFKDWHQVGSKLEFRVGKASLTTVHQAVFPQFGQLSQFL